MTSDPYTAEQRATIRELAQDIPEDVDLGGSIPSTGGVATLAAFYPSETLEWRIAPDGSIL